MKLFNRLITFVALSAPLQAAIVTTPAGTLTGVASDTLAFDTWLRTDVRIDSTIGITSTYAHLGDGSFEMTGASSASKADLAYYPATGFGTLASLTSITYSWFRSSSSTTQTQLHPSIRIAYDVDGNLLTPGDRGVLVFEGIFNGRNTAPTDQWVTDVLNGSTNIWQKGVQVANTIYNRTLDQWRNGYTQTLAETAQGQVFLSGTTRIIGITSGTGSGWNDIFNGAVDDIRVSVNSVEVLNANFELIPEPSTALLSVLGLGLLLGKRNR